MGSHGHRGKRHPCAPVGPSNSAPGAHAVERRWVDVYSNSIYNGQELGPWVSSGGCNEVPRAGEPTGVQCLPDLEGDVRHPRVSRLVPSEAVGVGTPGPWPAPRCGEAAGPLGFLTTGRHRLPVPPSFHVCVCLPAADLAHWTWASLMASLELAGLREPRSAPTPTPPRAAGVRTLTCERRGPTGMTKLPVDRATQSSQPMTPRVRLCNKPVKV